MCISFLFIEQNSTCGKSELNNVAIINMDLIKTVVVVKEASEHNLATLSSLNPPKVSYCPFALFLTLYFSVSL